MRKIRTIILKEWAEVFKNRLVLFTTLFMPLLFTALPLIILYFSFHVNSSMENISGDLPAQFERMCAERAGGLNCIIYYLLSQFIILFMMMPVIIPVNIAAYSIVGEKTTRSLEPLLATPITTSELILGKNFAASLPAVVATFVGYLLFSFGAIIITNDSAILNFIVDPVWLTAVFLVGPLLSILSVNFAMMVSSRVTDPRVAEQLSVVVILPLLLILFGQIAGLIIFNGTLVIVLAVFILILDIALVPVVIKTFQRENILTRWK